MSANPILFQVYVIYRVFKSKAFGDITWKYGDDKDDIAKEAFRSVLIVGPDASIDALPTWSALESMNTGFVSTLNRKYPVPDPVSTA